ncbi:MAG: hypothetical protein MZU84_01800 [Sphingobacterium sp.]|nr:hypothetical protein [Sphingobacterium sp.]
MDRRRQRRAAVHAEGRQLRPAAQHQLLHAQAAGDAGRRGATAARAGAGWRTTGRGRRTS